MTIDRSYYSRSLKILDKNLISGSADKLRTALDAAWDKKQGETTNSSEYVPKTFERQSFPLPPEMYESMGFSGTTENTLIPTNDYIDFFTRHQFDGNILREVAFSSKTPIPIIKYPVRLYGDNKTIYSDLHWQKYLAGGMYNEQEYEGIFTNKEFTDHWFVYNLGYDPVDVKEAAPESPERYQQIDISYDYNHYYKNYEKANSELESERLIPNAYMLQTLNHVDQYDITVSPEVFANSLYGTKTINHITREGKFKYSDYRQIMYTQTDRNTMYAMSLGVAPGMAGAVGTSPDTTSIASLVNTKKYFEYYYPLHPISSSTSEYINNKFKNVLMDHKFIKNEYAELFLNRTALPYYSKINLPPAGKGAMCKTIEDADASSKFLLTIKEIFVDNSLATKPTSNTFTVQETGHLNPKQETNEIFDLNVRMTNIGDFLTEMRNNYLSQNDDFCCLGDPTELSRMALYDSKGDYRYLNTLSSTEVMSNFINEFDNDSFLEKIKSPYEKSSITAKENETLAFRIEKIGGIGQGDDRTQDVIQNFYLFNASESDAASFIDSQVKYGEVYTYNIYAYVYVKGYRYQASDLRVTKQISDLTRDEDVVSVYCLEFYDPYTGERKDKLVKSSEVLGGIALDNTFATEAQVASYKYNYLADFNISIQPSIQLVEVPVGTNTVRIMDHPVNIAQMLPFDVPDASGRVGLSLRYNEFEKLPYPETLTLDEDILKSNYLASNRLFANDKIEKQSISSARYLEIYRLSELPTDYKQFEGHRVHFADLISKKYTSPPIDDDGIPQPFNSIWWESKDTSTYSTHTHYDSVSTNQKYYYASRFLNERYEPGHFSPIYSVELINDGGYNYTKFDVIYKYQLNPDTAVKPIKSFKKLINLVPTLQHLYLDDTEVDYSKSAFSQKENLIVGFANNKIWGKRFKIRLTSKKTGKKIDLNITYRLSR